LNFYKLTFFLVAILFWSALSSQTYIDRKGLWLDGFLRDTAFIKNNFKTSDVKYRKSEVIPRQIGITKAIKDDILQKGEWTRLDYGLFSWQLVIKVENANALNIYFADLELAARDELVIMGSDDRALKLDSGTSISNFGTSPFRGNILYIQFVGETLRQLPFKLKEIGIIDISNKRDFGDAAYCEISVNCPEGNNYSKIKNSVARILVKQSNSLFWCTGSLINNTAADGTPYFLTANHCGNSSTPEDYTDWVFDFGFESPDCDFPVLEPAKNTVYGSELLAKAPEGIDSYSDFKLLLLKQNPPASTKPFYVGWDRTGTTANYGASIHHPQGDIKMISTYSQALISTDYHDPSENTNGKYWKVNWSETQSGHGVTEGGSSGSPIYNEQGLLIGTLTGGDASCSLADAPDWYGKFSYHWESNGNDSATMLKYWLDPLNTNTEVLNGTDLDTNNLSAYFSAESTTITLGSGVEFTNLSQGGIDEYEWYFEAGEPETSTEKNPGIIRYYHSGIFDVKLVVRTGSSSDSLIRKDYMAVSSYVFPTVTQRFARIMLGSIAPDKVNVSIFSGNGAKAGQIDYPVVSNNGELKIDLQDFRSGIYIILLNIDGFEQTYKVVLIK
jgi:hypothetical protein